MAPCRRERNGGHTRSRRMASGRRRRRHRRDCLCPGIRARGANSTIRHRVLAGQPSARQPTWTQSVVVAPNSLTPASATACHIGTIRITRAAAPAFVQRRAARGRREGSRSGTRPGPPCLRSLMEAKIGPSMFMPFGSTFYEISSDVFLFLFFFFFFWSIAARRTAACRIGLAQESAAERCNASNGSGP